MKILSKEVTDLFLNSINIENKPFFIKISDFKGFRIKVNPSGRICYITYGRIKGGGNPRTVTHGTIKSLTFPQAIDKHLSVINMLEKGLDPNLIKKSKIKQFSLSTNFQSVALDYINKKFISGEHSKQHHRHNLNYLLNKKLISFHKISINDISVEQLESWYRNNKHTPAATRNALMLMSKIFKYSTLAGLAYIERNPVDGLKLSMNIKPQSIKKKQLDINIEYSDFLYELCDPMNEHNLNRAIRNIIYLMLITGLKKNDILKLKKEQIVGNSHISIMKRNNFLQIIPITKNIEMTITDTIEFLENNNRDIIDHNYLFYNEKTYKPISNLRKALTKLSIGFDWEVYPEAIRKSFANICDQSLIPRIHYYQLLGIRESYVPHSDNRMEQTQIEELRMSLEIVQKKIDSLCPLIVPGRYNSISDILF